jgi:predicted negative regulator of RcsB-dependent stress response
MMNTLKEFLVAGFLVLFIGAGSNVAAAETALTAVAQSSSTTIAHLEEALKAVEANELEAAQEYINAAGQSSKEILGVCSVESKKQRGSGAIANARRQAKEGNAAGAAESLKKAIEVFKSMPLTVEAARPAR